MSPEREKIVDSYIGKDDLLNVYSAVYTGLMRLGFSADKANRYAWFTQAIYKELKDQHDVVAALKSIANANKVLPNAASMNLVKSVGVLKDARLSGGAGVVAPFIDRFATIAKQNGIELNECSLSVTKVSLDIAGAGVGALTSVEGIGIPILFLSVVATFNDSYSLGKACFY